MIDYTIKEYNTKTRKYTTIGYVTAVSYTHLTLPTKA